MRRVQRLGKASRALSALAVLALTAGLAGCGGDDSAPAADADDCHGVPLPEGAISCATCEANVWKDCDYGTPPTCDEDCGLVAAGYTCDQETLTCNCLGALCGEGQKCGSTGCVDKGRIVLDVPDGAATSEEGGTVEVKVSLSADPMATVTLPVSVANADGTSAPYAQVDKASLTFTPQDWNDPQTVTVTGKDDGPVVNASTHTYQVIFGPATVSDEASEGAAKDYAGLATTAVLTNLDNDSPDIVATPASFSVAENGEPVDVAVTLSTRPVSKTAITASVSNTQVCAIHTDSGDFQTKSLEFSEEGDDYAAPHVVTVTAKDNDAVDGERPCKLMLTAKSGDKDPATSYDGKTLVVEGKVTDDDKAGINGFGPASITLAEDAGSGWATSKAMSVTLASKPKASVTLTFTGENVSDPSDTFKHLDVTPASITFSPTGFDAPQQVTLSVVRDYQFKGPSNVRVYANASSSTDADYDGISSNVIVQVVNSDKVGIEIGAISGTDLSEAYPNSYQTIKYRLTSKPTGTVNLKITPSNSNRFGLCNASNGNRFAEVASLFTPSTWNEWKTIYVYPIDDELMNGAGSTYVTFTAIASSEDKDYVGATAQSPSFTIADDDQPLRSLTVTCSGFAACIPANGTGECTASLSSANQPADKAPVTLTCTSNPSLKVPNGTLSTSNGYSLSTTGMVSGHCGSSLDGTDSGTATITCSATNSSGFKATGSTTLGFRYHYLDYP